MKFRAWHDEHEWASEVIVHQDGRFEVVWIDRSYKSENFHDGQPNRVYDAAKDGWILEQSVGMNAVNVGQEIFVGDIVQVLDSTKNLSLTLVHAIGRLDVGRVLVIPGGFAIGFEVPGANSVQAQFIGALKQQDLLLLGNIHDNVNWMVSFQKVEVLK